MLARLFSFLPDSITNSLAPIHPAGTPFIAIFAVAALILGWLWSPLLWVGLALTGFCAYFFRDPQRVTPTRAGLVVSPADGRISFVGPAPSPSELGLSGQEYIRISVFMSVLDVHVNRAPCAGVIKDITYRAGKFLSADLDKASEENERSGMVLTTPHGDIGVVQIAGLVARRIVGFVAPGQTLAAGDRYGLIRFGSRVDVYVPAGTFISVGLGQRAIAGETILADFGTHERYKTQFARG